MSAYHFNTAYQQPSSSSSHSSGPSHNHSHNHHGGRSRRAPRLSSSQNSHRQFRGVRSMKELTETPPALIFWTRFEAQRSFDLDDDLEFCPALLTDDDLQSISSGSSAGSLSSGSPQTSPLQPSIQPQPSTTPSFSLSSAASNNSYNPVTGYQSNNNHHMKLHQPSALRSRNAIPIVNPTTGMRLPSPPSSISPAMMQQQTYQRQW